MGYLLNILLRPELNGTAKHHKQRIHTLHLRTTKEWEATIENSAEQANLHRFVYEIDFKIKSNENLRDKLQKVTGLNLLPLIRFYEKSTLIPYQTDKIGFEFKDIKDIQRALSGFRYISIDQQHDILTFIPLNNTFLRGEISNENNSVDSKYFTINISKNKLENSGSIITSENDTRSVFFDTSQPGNKITDLVEKDFNCWYRFLCHINGEEYFDYVLFTITPANRAWYVSLDFGSEASQYLLRNAHLQENLRFPLVTSPYGKGLFISSLHRLLQGNDTFLPEDFLQYAPEEPTLYNSIFPVYYKPRIRELEGEGEVQSWKPYKFILNRKVTLPGNVRTSYITFLLGMQQAIDSANDQQLLPNLKVLKQLINLRKIARDEEGRDDYNSAIKAANQTIEFLAARYGMKDHGLVQYEILEEELINTYYREVLNTLLVAILSNLHPAVIGTGAAFSLLNFATKSLNIVVRILLPNMFGADDIMQIQNWLRHDIRTYATQVNEYIERQGVLSQVQQANATQLKETFALLNTLEILFLPEGEAAAETLHGSFNQPGNTQSPITDFMVVDLGKGTTDISIMERNNNGMLATQFRTGFAGAGNMMSYHCMKAFLLELFNRLRSMIPGATFTLDAYKRYLTSLHGSLQYDKKIDMLAFNNITDRKGFSGESAKFLYLVHPVVLEKLFESFESISAENIFLARITDAIKKSICNNNPDAIRINLTDVIFELGWTKELITPGRLEGAWLNAGQVKPFEKYMRDKKFIFGDPQAEEIYARGYALISETAAFLVEPYLKEKLGNKTLHVFFTGRAANDIHLKEALSRALQAGGAGDQEIKLEFPPIEDFLSEDADVSQALKTVGIHGAATKAISLNYSANISGQLMEIHEDSKNFLKKWFSSPRPHNSQMQFTGTPDSFFMESVNLSSISNDLGKFSMNGYRCYTKDATDYKGKIYFTNYGFRLYEYHDGQCSQSVEANLAKPLSETTGDGTPFLKRLVELSSKSLYPLCNGRDLFGFVLQ